MTKKHKKHDAKKAPAEAGAERAAEQADPIEEMREQMNQATDRALRSQAELENYRKRAAREMDEQRRYANLYLMRDLLPVLDNVR